MRLPSWLRPFTARPYPARARRAPRRPSFRPGVELLEDRTTPSVVQVTNLPFVSGPSDLTPVGSTLYFLADDGTNASHLWRTDVRTGETVPVESGSQPVAPDQTQLGAQVGSWLYFISHNTDGTYTLWRNNSSASPIGGISTSERV